MFTKSRSPSKLFANYLNPFNPSTAIKYQLAEGSQVSLKVCDVMGREVTIIELHWELMSLEWKQVNL